MILSRFQYLFAGVYGSVLATLLHFPWMRGQPEKKSYKLREKESN
jgi:hypothetical protein